jgi:hypothetical protein
MNLFTMARKNSQNCGKFAGIPHITGMFACADGKLLIPAARKNGRCDFRPSMKPFICSLLVAWLSAPPSLAQVAPAELHIVMVKGDGAVHDGRRYATPTPTVRIEDEHHHPVASALVSFTLPTEGATGEFANHSRTITVMTDNEGTAVVSGLRTNRVPGKVPIHIDVWYRGLRVHGSMMQYNVSYQGPGAAFTAAGRQP